MSNTRLVSSAYPEICSGKGLCVRGLGTNLTIPHRALRYLVCENFAKSSFCEVTKLQNAGLPILILSQTD